MKLKLTLLPVDLTPLPPRSARLPVGAVCSPGPEPSDPSPGEKIDAGWEEEHDSAPGILGEQQVLEHEQGRVGTEASHGGY